ncbi:MAG: APC family permease, partial [Actinomycetota bacterium]|nr:APC family permease [Actinomycetota bacterium]
MITQWVRAKRTLVGRPLSTTELEEQLLPKSLALPVFASDPLSSVAYATEEIMLVLALAGAVAFSRLIPISLAIALLVIIVVASYRQTVRAYPQGGGAFLVSLDNLGLRPAMVAAAALLTDYVLTVTVSVAAGVAAITSAAPALLDWRVELGIAFVLLVTVANLRGLKESGTLFAIPTYAFAATVGVMLVTGLARCLDGGCPQAASSTLELEAEVGALSLFLVLRAFASGATALTGIEAIADGVAAFRRPQSRNAAATLGIMGAMSVTMFLGIGTLSRLFGVRISEETIDEFGTVISQVGRTAFDGGIGFYVLQIFTTGILVLAANTAYQDFPRLSAILAGHKLMPRQFRNRGDRLVFSNGIIILALLAISLLIAFDAEVSRLIQLYVVGVFTSFTLSQSGMVRRWLRTREPGWQRSIVPNAIGAATTAVVLVVTAAVKFVHGAWIVVVAIPLFVGLMELVRRHYRWVADQLRLQEARPQVLARTRAVVLVSHTGVATRRAIQYARLICTDGEEVKVVHAREPGDDDLLDTWDRLYPDLP